MKHGVSVFFCVAMMIFMLIMGIFAGTAQANSTRRETVVKTQSTWTKTKGPSHASGDMFIKEVTVNGDRCRIIQSDYFKGGVGMTCEWSQR